jgi:excisionase family DNA binding protein
MTEYHERTLTLQEYAEAAGISTVTATKWILSGKVKGHKTPGGQWRIPATEVERRDLSIKQFARLVGVYPGTARNWCANHEITCRKDHSGYWRIPMSEVVKVGVRRKSSPRKAPR